MKPLVEGGRWNASFSSSGATASAQTASKAPTLHRAAAAVSTFQSNPLTSFCLMFQLPLSRQAKSWNGGFRLKKIFAKSGILSLLRVAFNVNPLASTLNYSVGSLYFPAT